MDRDLAELVVSTAQDLGVQYAEARIQRSHFLGCLLKNGEGEPAMLSNSLGLGIRILNRGGLAFGASNNLSRSNVREMVRSLATSAKASSKYIKSKVEFSRETSKTAKWSAKERVNLEGISYEDILSSLKEVDNSIIQSNNKIRNRLLSLSITIQEKYITNSDGSRIESRVPRVGFFGMLTASEGGSTAQRMLQLGGSGGWEVEKKLALNDVCSRESIILGRVLKEAKSSPKGKLDIIIGPDVAGIIAHEHCGHPTEADRVLGREAAQAGESFLKPNEVATKIGSDESFVSDDPTIPGSYGFYLYDDEGVKARKRKLLDGGKVKELLHNRSTAKEFKTRSNGSSRAIGFDREPIVRMANTFIEPGDYSVEELFEGVKQGVYIKSFMEWNIDDKRLNGRFVGLEAYNIVNGKITNMVRDPVLEITTPKLWGSIDARAKDLEFSAASCGKGDPMQGAPVWTGGPHVRLRGIRLGSR
ncbi:MAG: TldD/PmbA family protein [Thaumarchaeota archaeon]|nr:TldD/PmbA family protein [Nitrososphaerota archaeon]MCZ6724896.1 TldD/PmbA family protein [Nitrososphaerota archaeon]